MVFFCVVSDFIVWWLRLNMLGMYDMFICGVKRLYR